jgi:hypothetical protein
MSDEDASIQADNSEPDAGRQLAIELHQVLDRILDAACDADEANFLVDDAYGIPYPDRGELHVGPEPTERRNAKVLLPATIEQLAELAARLARDVAAYQVLLFKLGRER